MKSQFHSQIFSVPKLPVSDFSALFCNSCLSKRAKANLDSEQNGKLYAKQHRTEENTGKLFCHVRPEFLRTSPAHLLSTAYSAQVLTVLRVSISANQLHV